jgi:TIR domain-containing protein
VLSGRFGEEQVFMDLSLEPGVDFVEQINEAVGSCRVLVAVIGPRWASMQDAHGRRRLDDPADFIRVEVEAALRRPDVRVVPVLVQGATMPGADELPPSLANLARRNALELSDARWRHDMDRLTSTVERVLGVRAQPSAGVQEAGSTRHGEETGAAGADVEARRSNLEGDGRSHERPASGGWLRRYLRVAIPLLVIGVAVAIGAAVFAGRDQSNSSPTSSEGTIYSDAEPHVSPDEIEVSGLSAAGQHAKPDIGDRIEISFSLKNVGSEPVTLEATFVGARDPDGGHEDFGHENEGKLFAPGEVLEISRSVVVDTPGVWEFWPCYTLAARPEVIYCPDKWRSFEVLVAE